MHCPGAAGAHNETVVPCWQLTHADLLVAGVYRSSLTKRAEDGLGLFPALG